MNSSGNNKTEPAQTKNRKLGALLAVILFSAFSAGVNQGVMNIALPHVSEAFGVPISWANWLTVGFMVVAGTTITTAASLQARIGLKKLLAFSSITLVVGSLISAFAINFWMLILGRLIQAIQTGIMFPTATAVIIKTVPVEKHGKWLATDSGIIAVGMALGPLFSGSLLTSLGLEAVFIGMAVLGVVLFLLTIKFVYTVEARSDKKIDPLSVVMSFIGLGLLMYGLGEVFRELVPSLITIALGALIILLFSLRQFRLKDPLLNLSPLKHPRFLLGEILVMFAMVAEMSLAVLLPLYFEGYAGVTAFVAGALMVLPILADAVFAQLGGRIDDHFGIWPLVPIGFVLVAVGIGGVLLCSSLGFVIAAVAGASALTYAGIGFIVAPCKSIAIGFLPKEMVSHGSSINSVLVQIANSIGSAVFVGILSADVLQGTHAGMSKSAAYALGFEHTVIFGVVCALVGVVFSVIYCLKVRKHSKK